MTEFLFRGDIPGSKSIFNRALIVQSYFPEFLLRGFSECDDVRYMREGLKKISEQSEIYCGEGGTTFRFMALRVSRHPGRHVLEVEPRLLERPQKGLIELLEQLGARVTISGNTMTILSEGWKKPKQVLRIETSESSQYASALILNSWLLDFDLEFELIGSKVSEAYFDLTMKLLAEFGMQIKPVVKTSGTHFVVPRNQRSQKKEYTIEADLSSAFTMAAAGAISGCCEIQNFPIKSNQPDKAFVDILESMGAKVSIEGNTLSVTKAMKLRAVECDLYQSPDLFPVLAVVCSWAEGTSKLYNAPQLVKKESNRIRKVSELLSLVRVNHEVLPDGIVIHGNSRQSLVRQQRFNPDKDHRMVMAAALMKLKGHDIHIEEAHAINKSFPEFWEMIGLQA